MFENAKESYTDLYPLLDDKVDFLFEYGQILSRTAAYVESNAVFEKAMRISADPMFYNVSARNCQQLKDYHQAEMYLIKSSQIVPNRLYPWYLLTKLYVEVGDMEKARSAAEMVYKKELKVHSMAIDEMRDEIRMLMKTQNNK
jgi:tetratricopeptide (TPR) repeat protein